MINKFTSKVMRSICRYYIFETLRTLKSSCIECAEWNDIMISEDGYGDVPDLFYKWPHVNENLVEQYGEEQLKK